MSRAEQDLRNAFERLKSGAPEVLPKGTKVSQNNVAREARKDPSAFKKSRYPTLISEIQAYVKAFQGEPSSSLRRATLVRRKKARSLEQRLKDTVLERDHAMSLLVGADSKILELHQRIADLEARLPPPTVRSLR